VEIASDGTRTRDLGVTGRVEPILSEMTLVERLLRLWTEPVAAPGEALAAFGEAYTDPVVINGVEVPLSDLVPLGGGPPVPGG
jgi:hypothetical protein